MRRVRRPTQDRRAREPAGTQALDRATKQALLSTQRWDAPQLAEYAGYGDAFWTAYFAIQERADGEKLELALSTLRTLATDRGSESPYLQFEIGRALLQLGRQADARATLVRALDLLPARAGKATRIRIHRLLADEALRVGDDARAESELRRESSLSPLEPDGHLRLAAFLRSRGRLEEASRAADRASRGRGGATAATCRERTLVEWALDRRAEAIRTLEGLSSADGGDGPEILELLAELNEAAGNPLRAAELLSGLAERSDDALSFHHHAEAARLWAALGHPERSRTHRDRSNELAPRSEPVTPPVPADAEPCPLLPSQREYLGSPNPHVIFPRTYGWTLTEEVRPDEVDAIVGALTDRHDALRCCFLRAPSGEWRQVVVPPGEGGHGPIVLDLSRVSRARQEEAMGTVLAHYARRARIDERCVVWVLFDLGGRPRSRRLEMMPHHLTTDVVSAMILSRDVALADAQLAASDPVRLPPTTTLRTWATTMARWGEEDRFGDRAREWRSELDRVETELRWVVAPSGARTSGTKFVVDAELTRALVGRGPSQYGVSIEAILTTAVLRALHVVTGHRTIGLSTAGHGRLRLPDGLDLRRTVGPLFHWTPVVVEVGGERLDRLISTVSDRLRDDGDRRIACQTLSCFGRDRALAERLSNHPARGIRINFIDARLAARPRLAGKFSPMTSRPVTRGDFRDGGSALFYFQFLLEAAGLSASVSSRTPDVGISARLAVSVVDALERMLR